MFDPVVAMPFSRRAKTGTYNFLSYEISFHLVCFQWHKDLQLCFIFFAPFSSKYNAKVFTFSKGIVCFSVVETIFVSVMIVLISHQEALLSMQIVETSE